MWRAAVYSQWTELVAGSKIRRVHFRSLSDYIAPGESRELRVLSEALQYSQATSAIVSVHPPYYIQKKKKGQHRDIISFCGTFPRRGLYYNRTTSVVRKSLMYNPVVRVDLPPCQARGQEHILWTPPMQGLQK
jgi:hypothetical protein